MSLFRVGIHREKQSKRQYELPIFAGVSDMHFIDLVNDFLSFAPIMPRLMPSV